MFEGYSSLVETVNFATTGTVSRSLAYYARDTANCYASSLGGGGNEPCDCLLRDRFSFDGLTRSFEQTLEVIEMRIGLRIREVRVCEVLEIRMNRS